MGVSGEGVATNGVKTWIERASLVLDLLSKLSLTTFLLILAGLGVAAYFGWIANPIGQLPQQLQTHEDRMSAVMHSRTETDKNMVVVLEGLKGELVRINRVQRIRTCSEIADRLLREMCLQ